MSRFLLLSKFYIANKITIGRNVRIGLGTVIDPDVILGDNILIGHNCVIRRGVRIETGAVIGHNSIIEVHAKIGFEARVQGMSYVAEYMEVGDSTFVGPGFMSTTDNKIVSHGRGNFKADPPIIKRGARLGARVTLLPGVVIGENAFVGVGSLVSKSVPDKQVWRGVGTAAEAVGHVPEEELI